MSTNYTPELSASMVTGYLNNLIHPQVTENLNLLTSQIERLGPAIFMDLYTQFNAPFAGGVALLAAQIHRQYNKLRVGDMELADQIASYVFAAAEDEYRAPDGRRITHRQLARFTSKFLLTTYQPSLLTNRSYQEYSRHLRNNWTDSVYSGYDPTSRNSQISTVLSTLQSIGFHIGSEFAADLEFNAIVSYLSTNYPQVLEQLKNHKHPQYKGVTAYTWLDIHTHVEAEHSELALQAYMLANQAVIQHLGHERNYVQNFVYKGIDDFILFQREAFQSLIGVVSETTVELQPVS